MSTQLLLTILTLVTSTVFALDNGLGLTPQMGWNSWNKFGCNITEDLIKETTELIIQLGLHEVGYTYVNLDDCWMMEERDQ